MKEGTNTAWRDLLTCMVFAFVFVSMLLVLYVSPKAKQTEDGKTPPGNVMVEILWPDNMNTDVDLWVKAPGDVPVGYSNLNGRVFNLLRDDLGTNADLMPLNFEDAYSRGMPPGEYIVNVHLFSNNAGVYPVPVSVKVSVRKEGGRTVNLLFSKVSLTFVGQELTVFRFDLNKEGALVPGSVSDLPAKLRAA